MNLNKIFIDKGIYKLKDTKNNIFLCESTSSTIGKIVLFEEVSKELFKRTNIAYFLNIFKEGDLKELFVNRENYDMVGKVDDNYILTDDKMFLAVKSTRRNK